MSRVREVYELTFSTRRLSDMLEDAGWNVRVPSDQQGAVVRFVSDPVEGTIRFEKVLVQPGGRELIAVGVEELSGLRHVDGVSPAGQYL